MRIPLKDRAGRVLREVVVSDDLFGVPMTASLKTVIHQAVAMQQANLRSGTSDTKTRGLVQGSTRKLYAQKGTGRARAGSIRSPLRRGGGVVFGPHPRDYRQRMPKKMRRLAIRGALSSKVAEGRLALVDDLGIDEPKCKEMIRVLGALGAGFSTLIVTPEPRESVVKSARNLQRVKVLPAPYINVLDMLSHDLLVMDLDALRKAEQIWAPGFVPPTEEIPQKKAEAKKRDGEKRPRATRTRKTTSKAKVDA